MPDCLAPIHPPCRAGFATLCALAFASLMLLSACDERRIDKLEEGTATEMDVMRQFGAPIEIHTEPDGARTFEYTRQPEGTTNYFITIGSDGKMSALRQVLHPQYFERVRAGMTQAQVRRLLGQPARTQRYAAQPGEDWAWRWQDGPNAVRLFSVSFGPDGRVLHSEVSDDQRAQQGWH
ncbi:MAG: outer membrane protein assembly factor BamE [Leptothrix sp. (in: b-proteobacteria)]